MVEEVRRTMVETLLLAGKLIAAITAVMTFVVGLLAFVASAARDTLTDYLRDVWHVAEFEAAVADINARLDANTAAVHAANLPALTAAVARLDAAMRDVAPETVADFDYFLTRIESPCHPSEPCALTVVARRMEGREGCSAPVVIGLEVRDYDGMFFDVAPHNLRPPRQLDARQYRILPMAFVTPDTDDYGPAIFRLGLEYDCDGQDIEQWTKWLPFEIQPRSGAAP